MAAPPTFGNSAGYKPPNPFAGLNMPTFTAPSVGGIPGGVGSGTTYSLGGGTVPKPQRQAAPQQQPAPRPQPGILDPHKQGFGEQTTQQVAGQLLGGPSAASAEWATMSGQLPTQAGLDPYYQNALREQNETLNAQLAGRGMLGSTAGMELLQGGVTDLMAEKANREADYALSLAQTRGGLASSADSSEVSRLTAGGSAGVTAQQLQENRLQNFLDEMARQTQLGAGIELPIMEAGIGDVHSIEEQIMNLLLGKTSAEAEGAAAQGTARREGAGIFSNIVGGIL